MTPQEALNKAEELRTSANDLANQSEANRRKASILTNWANVMLAVGEMAAVDKDLIQLLPEDMQKIVSAEKK